MSKKAKIIIGVSAVVLIGGGAYWFFIWRKRRGVSEQDKVELEDQKVVLNDNAALAGAIDTFMKVPLPIMY